MHCHCQEHRGVAEQQWERQGEKDGEAAAIKSLLHCESGG